MPTAAVHTRLDLLILCATIGYFTISVLFRYVFWGGLDSLDHALAGGTADFVAEFGRRTDTARLVLFPLGTMTVLLIMAGLAREGGMTTSRGLLRAGAAAAVLFSGFGKIAVQLSEREITQAAGQAGSDAGGLLQTWLGWQNLFLIASAAAVVAVVLADRAVRPIVRAGERPVATRRQVRLLALLGTATLFEGYDRFILSLALPYIAADLGVGEGSLGITLAIIRAGALFAVLLGRLADRFGRRPLLLFTIVGYTVATAATGFSRGIVDLAFFQIVAMGFLAAELSLAQVVIAEEYPPGERATGQGHLGAAAALGAGLAALLFPILVRTTLGWRGLYFVGILPLLLVTYLRRSLPETTRWSKLERDRTAQASSRELLAPGYRRPLLVLLILTVVATAAAAAAFAFHSYRATEVLGWPPERISLMVLVGGGLGFWGWMVFGVLADRIGRRPVGIVCLICGAVAIIAFYQSHYLMIAFTALVFFESGITIAINALATELFPTHLRATAKAWVTNAAVLGAMCGLGLVGTLAEGAGGHGTVIAALALAPALLSPLLLLLPDTHRGDLETTSGERA
jgi:putative MFS transporter